jgi:TIR domain/Sel1 repeat
MAKVFLSYRRDDSAAYAGRLYDRLVAHFGAGQVFMDIDQIEPGEDFVEVINQKVSATRTVIVLIGRQWLSATDADGQRRLDDPEDFVRVEVSAALERRVKVIPVLVGGATMPKLQQLPEALASLSRRNAIEISDTRFHHDVDRLIEALEKATLAPGAAEPPAGDSSAATTASPAEAPQQPATESTKPTPEAVPNNPPGHTESSADTKPATPAREPRVERRVATQNFAQAKIETERYHDATSSTDRSTKKPLMVAVSIGAVLLLLLGGFLISRERIDSTTEARAKELETWKQAIRAENPAATEADIDFAKGELFRLGEYRGLKWPRDWFLAAQMYGFAASEGHIGAALQLANLYKEGSGNVKDDKELAKYYLEKAKEGDKPAELRTALAYEFGRGLPQNNAEAMRWYLSAAERGNVYSQYRVAEMYRLGLGVERDVKKAFPWYEKAAAQGYKDAAARLEELGQPKFAPKPTS